MRVSAAAARRDTRDELVIENVALVKSLAQRLAQRLPSQVCIEDLVSAGMLGLIEAAGRYLPSLGVPFQAFARRRVHGAMLDALRDLDWAPRSLRRLRRDVDSAIAAVRAKTGKEPDDAALFMGEPAESVIDWYQQEGFKLENQQHAGHGVLCGLFGRGIAAVWQA